MRRLLLPFAIIAALIAVLVATTSGGDKPGRRYEIEVDNAFGLTDGADVKLAGVRAGTVDGFALDQQTRRAIVGLRLTQPGFEELHRDAFCRIRPQSLIGEYYIDCQPGTRGPALAEGTRLPVTHSSSAIGLDLINSVLRRPYNERLGILIGELGAGVAARGPDIRAALRRALPALDSTNNVLKQLASDRRELTDIALQGDRALADLARKRRDVSRFIAQAGKTADASANHEQALGAQFDRLPPFLRELAPSMRSLGQASDSGATSLAELARDAPGLTTLARRVGQVSDTATPAIKALGQASITGRQAAKDAAPALTELQRSTSQLPELARNARIVFEHLNSQSHAVEPDPRSPGGKGFSGFQAILYYIYNQSLAQNVYDGNGYLLKANLLSSGACGHYADPTAARKHPECAAGLGPTQPGVLTPDPTAPSPASSRSTVTAPSRVSSTSRVQRPRVTPTPTPTPKGNAASAPASTAGSKPTGGFSGLLDFLLKP